MNKGEDGKQPPSEPEETTLWGRIQYAAAARRGEENEHHLGRGPGSPGVKRVSLGPPVLSPNKTLWSPHWPTALKNGTVVLQWGSSFAPISSL